MALLTKTGTITLLRVNRRGTGFGPPADHIDGELIIQLSSSPLEAYGVTLRDDADGPVHRAMFDLLRDAFNAGRPVTLEVELETGRRNGLIFRAIAKPVVDGPDNPVVADGAFTGALGGVFVQPFTPN